MHTNLHSAWLQNKKIDKQGDTMANYKIISNAFNDYVLGMKYKQIAFKYGVKLNTVKSWVHRYEWARKRREVATNAPCSLDISQVNIKKIFLNLDLELDIDFKNNEVRNIKVINKNEV